MRWFLFKCNKLSIPKSPLRHLIMKEAHGGPLPGHFGINKTLEYLRCTFIGLRWVRVHIRSSQDVTFTIWLEVTSIKASKLVF